jgi:hypothetical protein
MNMREFDELGNRVAREWSKHRYAPGALPDLASTELDRNPLHRSIQYPDILDWVGTAETLPYQMNIEATFGEPPVTLYWHPSFFIEALYWASSTTTIHGHGFSGAFQVLAGTSLQSLFEFESADQARGTCRIGNLRQTKAALLRPGSTQQILGGEAFIHSVFHLGYPSVTIVVRTHHRSAGRQYTYYRPSVALAFNYEQAFDQRTNRLLQVARLQAILKLPDLAKTASAIGKTCDVAASFRFLQLVQPILSTQGRGEVAADIITRLVTTAGYKVAKLAEALNLESGLAPLWRARARAVEDDLRLCLALLLTRQDRRHVMSIVTDYVGTADPARKFAGWVRELALRTVLNIPADEHTEDLVVEWLESGGVGKPQVGTETTATRVEAWQRLKGERLLAPLLSDRAA